MNNIIVDTHPHVISPNIEKYPLDPLGGKRSTWSEDAHTNTAAQYIAAMDAAGVDKAVVVHSSTTYGYDNSLVLDSCDEYPDRLLPVCSIDMMAADAVDTLKSIIDRGCVGIRLFTTGSTMPGQAEWLNDPSTYPVWAYCETISLPICIQAQPAGMAMLRDMMDRYPGVPIFLDHIGRPDLSSGPPYQDAQQMLDIGKNYPQVFLKFTPNVILRLNKGAASAQSFMPLLMEAYGAKRLAWGSNFPASAGSLSDLLNSIRDVFEFLSEAEMNELMGGTATRIYPRLLD